MRKEPSPMLNYPVIFLLLEPRKTYKAHDDLQQGGTWRRQPDVKQGDRNSPAHEIGDRNAYAKLSLDSDTLFQTEGI